MTKVRLKRMRCNIVFVHTYDMYIYLRNNNIAVGLRMWLVSSRLVSLNLGEYHTYIHL